MTLRSENYKLYIKCDGIVLAISERDLKDNHLVPTVPVKSNLQHSGKFF